MGTGGGLIGSDTGGSTASGGASTGGASTGGDSGSGDCPKLPDNMEQPVSGTVCYTITVTEFGGWEIYNPADCVITIDGASGTNKETLTPDEPHEVEVSGCSVSYAAIKCFNCG